MKNPQTGLTAPSPHKKPGFGSPTLIKRLNYNSGFRLSRDRLARINGKKTSWI
jgi:hypothetical protein